MLGPIRQIVGVKFTLDFPLSVLGVFCYLILPLNFDGALLFYASISLNLAKN